MKTLQKKTAGIEKRTINVETSQGAFYLTGSKEGLYSLSFPRKQEPKNLEDDVGWAYPGLTEAAERLKQYFEDIPVSFEDLPIDFSGLTSFERRVLQKLKKVAFGKVQSYADLARAVGSPKAARAVGSVMRKNRLPIILPCHRILTSARALGGYSGGLHWKKFLLTLEGAKI